MSPPRTVSAALALAMLPLAAPAEEAPAHYRIAVVVGNEDYAAVPDLPNARRDAEDMAKLLRDYGFTVYDAYDVDRQGFEDLLREAMLNVPEGGDVVFFYSGHGIQIGRRNYLLPVDAAFQEVYDLPVYSVTLDRVIDALSSRGTTHVAIIDACRENPFPNLRLAADLDATIFETKAGFDVFRTPLNSLVAFSTSPGEVAFDGEKGGNSPYTAAVLSTVRSAPEESILTLFSEVREAVYKSTGGRQVPWESSTLVRPFRVLDPAVGVPRTVQAQAGTEQPQRSAEPAADSPTMVDLALPLERQIDVAAALEEALGAPLVAPSVTTTPERGMVSVGEGILYRPLLAETRAVDLPGFSITDSFTVETGPEGARHALSVRLSLAADACDLAAGDALDLDGVGLWRLPNELDPETAMRACSAAAGARPEVARFRYQLGRAQQAAGRFEEAFASFRAAAEAGHTRALTAEATLRNTSRIDRDLFDIPLDAAGAQALLERGIAAGDPFAMHALGSRLLHEGTGEERQRGFELMERAVELGHTYSMNGLGVYFLDKDTDHYLPERGMNYLQASSARNDIYGYHNLGFVALYGLDGQEPDFARAAQHFERAAEGGHPTSPSTLGRMILRGQLGAVDGAAAARWFDIGLERGDGWGGANAAGLIVDGDVPGLGPADAAVRAAKAVHLPAGDAAEEARAILAEIPEREINRGLQMLLADLGEPVTADGAVGPATLAALDRVRREAGLPEPGGGALDRLLLAAKAYWAERPVRLDLY